MNVQKRRKLIQRLVLGVVLGGSMYWIVFLSWWMGSPSEVRVTSVGTTRIVQVHYNRFFWITWRLWEPAFWVVENVGGYRWYAFAPMYEQSVITYVKLQRPD